MTGNDTKERISNEQLLQDADRRLMRFVSDTIFVAFAAPCLFDPELERASDALGTVKAWFEGDYSHEALYLPEIPSPEQHRATRQLISDRVEEREPDERERIADHIQVVREEMSAGVDSMDIELVSEHIPAVVDALRGLLGLRH